MIQAVLPAPERDRSDALSLRVCHFDRSWAVVNELSPRELEILALMADGWTNPGICQSLFLSAKTVEAHVRQIFIKLGLPPGGTEHRRVAAVLAYQEAYPRRAAS